MQTPVSTPKATRPNWAEISLSALRHNFSEFRKLVSPQAMVCAVVKCNAYGHDAVLCARALEADGARWFAVTGPEEGEEMRRAGIRGRILLMSGFWRGEQEAVVRHNLTPVVWSGEQLEQLQEAVSANSERFPVHLKVDTGMARLGITPREVPEFLQRLRSSDRLRLEGVLTHLASAEVVDAPDAQEQIERFDGVLGQIEAAGFAPAIVHMANSAAIMSRRPSWKSLVRPGISLYGYHLPFTAAQPAHKPAAAADVLDLRPVLSWRCRIIALRDVAAGQPLGYSGAYVAPAAARIAVLPVGYGDGLDRQLSSRGRVLLRGQSAPIVGNISMDLTLADVTSVHGAALGDEVTLIGRSGELSIDAWEHARFCHTIPYEILCNISHRVPRIARD